MTVALAGFGGMVVGYLMAWSMARIAVAWARLHVEHPELVERMRRDP